MKQKKTWSERFDDKFDNVRGSVYYEEESALGTGAIAHEIKDFIKQEILSVIEELRMEETEDEGMGWEDDLQRADGYNQAVEQLNDKIEEIKKRYEK